MGRFTNRTLILLSCVWLSIVAASEVEKVTAYLKRQEAEPIDCKTDRSGDYYGFGVRVGIYFNWWGAWIASTMKPDEISGQLDTNAIFMFALLVAMVRCSITKMLQQLDGLMLMHLSGATIFGVLSIWGYRTCYYLEKYDGLHGIKHFGGVGTHGRLLLATAVSAYGLWFWLYGVTGGLITGEGECEQVYTFFFAKLRIQGGIRGFYIFICVACLVYFGIMLIVSIVALYARINRFAYLTKTKQWANTTRLRYATGLTQKELRRFHLVMRWYTMVWLIFSMIMIEMTLNYNHVMSVLGQGGEVSLPSQLIPLLIGIISFCRVVYLKYESWRSPEDVDPSVVIATPADAGPKRAQTWNSNRQIFKLFSPAMERQSTFATAAPGTPVHHHEDDDVDELLDMYPKWRKIRYLVAWLPWLSLLMHQEFEKDYVHNQDLIDNNVRFDPGKDEDHHDHSQDKNHEYPSNSAQTRRKPLAVETGQQHQRLQNHNTEKIVLSSGDEDYETNSDEISQIKDQHYDRDTKRPNTNSSLSPSDPTAPQLPALELSRDDSFEKRVISAQKQTELASKPTIGLVVDDGERSRRPSSQQHRQGEPHQSRLTTRAQSIARKFGRSGISYERT